ncbi:hypothetical protein HYU94_03600 [Candidatus Daviesbacteria bacterium]|nr:hypothetical protein [Candidatus Daviesbacteria bacterium]
MSTPNPEQGELISEIEAFLKANKKESEAPKPEIVTPVVSEPSRTVITETSRVETPPVNLEAIKESQPEISTPEVPAIDLQAPKRPSRLLSKFNTMSAPKAFLGFACVSNSLAVGFDIAWALSHPGITMDALFVFATWANLNIAGAAGILLWAGYPRSKKP